MSTKQDHQLPARRSLVGEPVGRSAGTVPPGQPQGDRRAPDEAPESPDGRRDVRWTLIVLGILLLTMAVSLVVKKDKGLYVVGYIVAIVYATRGVLRGKRPWSAVGVKPLRTFFEDLKRVWPLAAIVVLVFQFLAPEMGVAALFGFYHPLIHHINARVSQVPTLIGLAIILSLLETIVYQVFTQERLTRFIGTPAAIILAAVLAGLAHAASGTSASFHLVFVDAAGVTLDFIVFGIIWAKTHNLAVTWATHYAADVAGIIALALVFR